MDGTSNIVSFFVYKMANEVLKRDQNYVTVLAGVTNDVDQDITMLRVDPISKRLLVAATGGGGGGEFLGVFSSAPSASTDGTTYINSITNGYYVAYQGLWNLIITLATNRFLLLNTGGYLLLNTGGRLKLNQ